MNVCAIKSTGSFLYLYQYWGISALYCTFSMLSCQSCLSITFYVLFALLYFCRNDEDADDDDVSPEHKAVREKLRRQQNNARERYCRKMTLLLSMKL